MAPLVAPLPTMRAGSSGEPPCGRRLAELAEGVVAGQQLEARLAPARRADRRGSRRPRRPASVAAERVRPARTAPPWPRPGAAVTLGDAAGDRAVGVEHRPARPWRRRAGAPSSAACSCGDQLAARGLGHRAAADAVGDDEQQRPDAPSRAVRVLVALVQAAARRRDRGVDLAEGDAVAGLARRRRQGDARPPQPGRGRLDRRHHAARCRRAGRHGTSGRVEGAARLPGGGGRSQHGPHQACSSSAGSAAGVASPSTSVCPGRQRNARAGGVGDAVDRHAVVAVDDDDGSRRSSSSTMSRWWPDTPSWRAVDDQRLVARAADADRQQRRCQRQRADAGGMRAGQAEGALVARRRQDLRRRRRQVGRDPRRQDRGARRAQGAAGSGDRRHQRGAAVAPGAAPATGSRSPAPRPAPRGRCAAPFASRTGGRADRRRRRRAALQSAPAGSIRTPLVEPASATHQPPCSSQTSAWRRLANVPSTRMSRPRPCRRRSAGPARRRAARPVAGRRRPRRRTRSAGPASGVPGTPPVGSAGAAPAGRRRRRPSRSSGRAR